MTDQKPSVGRIVHYVSYGTPGGEFRSQCRAAIVTEVSTVYADVIGLVALNPTGMFFHSLADGGCTQDEGDQGDISPAGVPAYKGGTWHWPERV